VVKVISMSKRKKGVTQEEFRKFWYEVHGPMVLEKVPPELLSRIKRYVQNPAVELRQPQAYDGVAEICFNDMDALRAWNKFYNSDEAKVLRDDQENFVDTSTMVVIITEEKIIKSD
jgi:uncharacterized protein (TIGR02118 family)